MVVDLLRDDANDEEPQPSSSETETKTGPPPAKRARVKAKAPPEPSTSSQRGTHRSVCVGRFEGLTKLVNARLLII